MNKRIFIIIAVILLSVLGGYFLMANRPNNKAEEEIKETEKAYTPPEQINTALTETKTETITKNVIQQPAPVDIKDNNSSTPNPVLKFSAGSCDPNMDPYTEPFEGISSQNWSSNILTVNAYVKTLCEGININGSYKLNGANLALKIDMTHSGPQGDCYCARVLSYKISDLEQKDYQISITRGE